MRPVHSEEPLLHTLLGIRPDPLHTGRLSPTWLLTAGLLVATGCRGCEGGSGADFAKNTEPKKEESAAKPEIPKSVLSRNAFRRIRNSKMRILNAPEVDRPLGEAVVKARGMVGNEDRLRALEAKKLLETWIETHPDDADAYYWKGRAELNAEEPRGSVKSFQAAIERAPDFVAPYRWGAYALSVRSECADAMPLLNKAVELEPEEAGVYLDRILCSHRLQQWDLVVQDLDMLCKMGEADPCLAKDAAIALKERKAARKTSKGRSSRAIEMGKTKAGKMGKLGKVGNFGGMRGKANFREAMKAKAKARAQAEADGTTEE